MCKITNEKSANILKTIRKIEKEGISSIPDSDLVEFYALAYTLQKEIENVLSVVKPVLVEKEIEETKFFDLGVKVKLTEGRSTTIYNNLAIAKAIGIESYASISNVVASKVVDDETKKVLEVNSEKKTGEPSLSVSKLTKKELIQG